MSDQSEQLNSMSSTRHGPNGVTKGRGTDEEWEIVFPNGRSGEHQTQARTYGKQLSSILGS